MDRITYKKFTFYGGDGEDAARKVYIVEYFAGYISPLKTLFYFRRKGSVILKK